MLDIASVKTMFVSKFTDSNKQSISVHDGG